MVVDVEVKGTSQHTAHHLELGLSRELQASAPYVHPKKLNEYYRVQVSSNRQKTLHASRFPVSLSRSDSWREGRTL